MKTSVKILAPAAAVWDLLIDTSRWAVWGPSVTGVEVAQQYISPGSTGRVKTIFGFWLPFRVTAFVDGQCWGWEVAGIPATRHLVTSLGADRCRLSFEVPLMAFPYLVICRVAIVRIKGMLEQNRG